MSDRTVEQIQHICDPLNTPLEVRKKTLVGPTTAMQFTDDNGPAIIDWLKSRRGWSRHTSDKDGRILSIGVSVVELSGRRTRTAYVCDWIVCDPWDHFEVVDEREFEATYEPV